MENDESFENLYKESIKKDYVLDKIVTGKIIEITSKGEIFVDISYKSDGIIPKKEYSYNENDNPRDEFKVGDLITAEVLKNNDGFGNVLLSYKKTKQKENREKFAQKVKDGEIFESEIMQINENGIITQVNENKVFIPISLSGIKDRGDLEKYKDQKIKFKIIEFDPENRKIIGSNKILSDENKKREEDLFWNNIEIGKEYNGKVDTINSYGAFVELGGAQGLLHISEITWRRNANIFDFIKEKQDIKVIVKDFDKENKRIQLTTSLKEVNPWNNISEKYKVTDIVNVSVRKIVPFGAFVEIEEGVEGLIHISQISDERITKPEEKLELNQKIDAKIISMDVENKKIELSIKDVKEKVYIDEIDKVDGITFTTET